MKFNMRLASKSRPLNDQVEEFDEGLILLAWVNYNPNMD